MVDWWVALLVVLWVVKRVDEKVGQRVETSVGNWAAQLDAS